jgi:hypothetical protein
MSFHDFIESISLGTIIVSLVLYAIIFQLSLLEYLKLKRVEFILLLLDCLGFIYDGLILTLGALMSEGILYGTNFLRYILHAILVPILIVFTGYALELTKIKLFINLAITLLFMILGLLAAINIKLKIEEFGNITRCKMHEDTPRWAKFIFTFINISSVIYMIIAGIILLKEKKDFSYLLSGFFMLIFSVIGPASGNLDLNFIFSVYGEILMVIFLFIFFKNNSSESIKQIHNFKIS